MDNIQMNRYNGTGWDVLLPKNAQVGTTAPTTSTAGYVGQVYLDTSGPTFYWCSNVSGSVYIWQKHTNGMYPTLTVNVTTGSTITCVSGSITLTGTSVAGSYTFTIPSYGSWVVTATLSGQTSTSASVVVDTVKVYTASLVYASTTLNDNSWATIQVVAQASMGANLWAVGDAKQVTFNGTVGALTLSSYNGCVFIIGFNHNATLEGNNTIHFQFGKTAITSGINVCFTDSYYSSTSSGFRMNTSNTNSGGWNSSNMRTALCGTSLSSYSGTFIGVLPAALRAVLKSVTKYTNNTGHSTAASAVTATTDYIFLLAEYEVFGSATHANSTEASYQSQYAYYTAGNSKIKYKHSSTPTAAFWWLRSPYFIDSYGFVIVYTDGTALTSDAGYSYGFAPAFAVG